VRQNRNFRLRILSCGILRTPHLHFELSNVAVGDPASSDKPVLGPSEAEVQTSIREPVSPKESTPDIPLYSYKRASPTPTMRYVCNESEANELVSKLEGYGPRSSPLLHMSATPVFLDLLSPVLGATTCARAGIPYSCTVDFHSHAPLSLQASRIRSGMACHVHSENVGTENCGAPAL
jgi:hypothetical protein